MTIPDLAETPSPTADPTLPADAPATPVADIPVAQTPEPPASPLAGDSSPEQGQTKGSGPTPVPPPLKTQRRPLPPATNQAAIIASGKDPKQWAEVVQLGKVFGVPTDYVERNLAVLRQQYAQQQYQSQVAESHPALGQWAADANNATLSKGEVVHLNRVAQATQGLVDDHARIQAEDGDGVYNAVANPLASGIAAQQKQLALIMAALAPDATRGEWIQKAADYSSRQAYLDQFAPEAVKRSGYEAEQHSQLYGGFRALMGEGLHDFTNADGTFTSRIKGIATAVQGGAMSLREAMVILGSSISPKTLPYTMAQSAAGLAPALVGGAAGGPVGGFVGFLPMALGGRIEKLIGDRADLNDPQSIAMALADPAFRKQVLAQTAIGGVTEATVMTALAALGGAAGAKVGAKVAGATVPTAARVAAEGFAKGADEALTREAVTAAYKSAPALTARAAEHATAATIGAAAVGAGQQAGNVTTTDKGVSLPEFAQTTGSMLGFGEAMHLIHGPLGDSPVARAVDATMQAGRAMDALRRGALLNEAGDAVREAPNTASQPDRLGDLVKGVTGSDDHPTIYFQKAEWDKTMAAAGLDPEKTASEILEDNGAGYAATVDTDAPLAVPLDKILAKAAPTEWWGKVKEIARHTPDGPTAKEAQADLSTTEGQLKGALAEIATSDLTSRPPLTEYGQQLLDIRNEYLSQFAGQRPADLGFGDRHAEVMANTMASVIHAQASHMGITPREAMALMPRLDFSRGIEGVAEGLKQREFTGTFKSKSFTTDEGRFAHYDLKSLSPRERPVMFTVFKGKDGYVVRNALLPEEMRRQGIASAFYEKMNAESEAKTGKPLKATEPRTLMTGEVVHELSADARSLWDSFVRQGKAVRTETGYRFRTQAERDALPQALHQRTRADFPSDAAFTAFQEKVKKEQGAIQGSTLFRADGSINIQFFQKADKSTFFHELAHYYTAALQHLSTVAPDSEAKGKYMADISALRDWVGAKEGEALTVPQHEQIARGFEQYLQEGKAPSLRLRDAFYRIRQWMLKLYKGLNVHGVQLTPEVRSVFDRMLASDAEIAEAERQSLGTPLFGDDPRAMGLSDAQAQSLQQARDDAHQKAIEQQTAKRMKEITRREKKKWKAWRDPIEAEVTAQVDAEPVQMAIAHLSKHETPAGVPLSEDLVPKVKLSKAALVAEYGEDILNGIPRAMVSTEEGIPAGVVADLYGFANGRDFLDAVRASKPRDLAIREETDTRMEMLHGQEMTPDAAKMAAQEYVMGEGRKAVLRKELEILASESMSSLKDVTRLVTKHIPPPEETKLRATAIIDDTKVGAVRPDLFRTAAFRAGNEAREALLAGDLELAMAKKKQELLATAIYDEAIAQRDRIDKAMEQMRKLFRSDARLESKHDLTFINGARALLGSLGIGTDRAYGSAVGYLNLSKEYAPEAYAAVEALSEDIAALGVSDYRKLTVGQFDEVLKTVGQLWELSTNAKTVMMDGRKQKLSEILAPIYEAVDARRVERIATRGITKKLGPMDTLEQKVLSFQAALTRVESWARAMDGLDVVDGPFSRVVRMVKDGTNAYRLRQGEILPHLVEESERLRGLPQRKDIEAKEIGYTFANMNELLGALLHTGNAEGSGSNLEKLLLGRGWATKDAETGVVDTSRWDTFIRRMWKEGVLTKAHYDWVQAVWDTFESMKPDLQRAFLEMTGRHMTEVAHTGFDTPFGHYKGGYYPAIGDTSVGKIFNADGSVSPMTVQVANAMRYAEENTLGHDSKFTNVQPASGMTKQRTGAVYPLVIDATQVPRHLDQTMKYIHISVPVRDAFKVFNDRTFREKMDGINPDIVEGALMPFLKAASSQRSTAPATTRAGRNFEFALNWLRTGAMRNLVQMNPTILAEQVAHLSTIQSMRTADNKAVVYYSDVLRSMAKITLAPKQMTDWIHQQSPTVAARDHRGLERATLDYKQLMDPSKLRTAQEETTHVISFVSHLITSVLDKSVWLGAYDRAIARGETESGAKAIADNAVREGLGGHNAEDVSEAQRKSAIARMLQGFYGFYNAKLNQFGADAFAQTMTDAGLKRDKMRMGAVYLLGFAMMGISGHGVRELMSGRKDQQDSGDDSFGDALLHWAGWALNAQAETGLALFPYTGAGRSLKDAGVALVQGHRPTTRDNTLASPFARFGEQAVGTMGAVAHGVRGEDITGKDIKDALGLFGTLSHIPATVLARPLAYAQDVHQGRATPTGPVDFTRGLLTGQRGGK